MSDAASAPLTQPLANGLRPTSPSQQHQDVSPATQGQIAVRDLFISWTPHSRPRGLAPRLGARYYVPAAFATKWFWPLRYLLQAIATAVAILRIRPTHIYFTNPPFLAGATCILAGHFVRADCWADCHSGAFNSARWSRFSRANAAVLRKCAGTIFHNNEMAARYGALAQASCVLSVYAVSDRLNNDPQAFLLSATRPVVVAICSYGPDEPVRVMLDAAARAGALDFRFTGNAPTSVRKRAPQNVVFTGWIDDDAFHALLDSAAVVLVLTTRDATMQNGIIEALEHGRPVVTSNTATLTAWGAGIPGISFAPPLDPACLADVVKQVASEPERWRLLARRGHLAAARRADQELQDLLAMVL